MRFGVEGVKIAAAVAALAGKLLSRSKSLASQIADEVLPSFFDHRQD